MGPIWDTGIPIFYHIGIGLDRAATEHAGVALAYDAQVNALARQMAETGRDRNQVEELGSDLNVEIKNNVFRVFGIMPTYTPSMSPRGKDGERQGWETEWNGPDIR